MLNQVDGFIQANSENTNSGGGGSGGSIYIHAEVLTGGHTGVIRATGGHSQRNGGGGAGGRIAAYFSNLETQSFFPGMFEIHGGRADNNAEPGASGTVFLNHVTKGYSTVHVNNKNQISHGDIIGNTGQRLLLSGGSKVLFHTYTTPGGIVVSSSSSIFVGYDIGQMFDENPGTAFIAASRSVRITFDLKSAMFVNHVRLYPTCSGLSGFKVNGLF